MKVHYPTHFQSDFDIKYQEIALDILKKSPSIIFSTLIDLLGQKEFKLLTCIIHILIETPLTKLSISIIGWYAINDLIPPPTLYLVLKQLISDLDSKKGLKHAIHFAKAVYPLLHRYKQFCIMLKSAPNLEYIDNNLFNSLPTFINTQVVKSYDTKHHYIIPKPLPIYTLTPDFLIRNSLPQFNKNYRFQIKENFNKTIDLAPNISEENRYSFYINFLLSFNPRKYYQNKDLLKSACLFAQTLIYEARSLRWESYDFHNQLFKVGNWISYLSFQNGFPAPYHLFPIHKLIKSSTVDGTLLEILIMLTGFFSNLNKTEFLQNPYTKSMIELVAAIKKIDSLRSDIIEAIEKFEKIVGIDLSLFVRAVFNSPRTSPIRFTKFQRNDFGCLIFQMPSTIKQPETFTNNPSLFYPYFFYLPQLDLKNMPVLIRNILKNIKKVEKYYFVGLPSNISYFDIENNHEYIQSIISLAVSSDRSISKLFFRLFKKILKRDQNNIRIDLSSIFRYFFPNKEILEVCFRANIVVDTDLNSLFSELLTNPITSKIAHDKIVNLMPLCLKYSKDSKFTSTKILLDCDIPTLNSYSIPYPDANNLNLLRSFLAFSKNPVDRTDFIDKMEKPTFNSIRSLILFVLNSTTKARNSISSTTYDYTIIDCLCYAFSKCSGKLNLENLTVRVIESIIINVIEACPKPFFRLVYGLLNCLHFQNTEKVIQLMESLSPGKFPSFACCWIQIVMHKTIFPQFLKQNTVKSLHFCLNFLATCFELVENAPEVFYKPVARILIVIETNQPFFFVCYSSLILQKLHFSFVQYRNIILGAVLQQDASLPPPHDFSFERYMKTVSLAEVIDRIQTDNQEPHDITDIDLGTNNLISHDDVECIVNVLRKNYQDQLRVEKSIKNTSITLTGTVHYVPNLFHHFICYSISKKFKAELLLIEVAKQLNDDEFAAYFLAIADQLRYPNSFSFAAMTFILNYFGIASNSHKEIILVELIKRSLCVTSPPSSVVNIIKQLHLKYEDMIRTLLQQNGEYETFLKAKDIFDHHFIQHSSSGHVFHLRE